METILFYIWTVGVIVSGWKVITSKNPVLSVIWLVSAFGNASLLLLLLGLEFLPILFIIVYVGAIAILFLFVVMLLNIKLVEITENATRYAPIGAIVGLVFLYEIFNTFKVESIENNLEIIEYTTIVKTTNIELIGEILYTEYWIYFIVSSLILLVSMVGAIVLCLYHEEGIKRQDLFAQVATEYTRTVQNVK